MHEHILTRCRPQLCARGLHRSRVTQYAEAQYQNREDLCLTKHRCAELQKIQSDACGIEPRNRSTLMTGLIGFEAFTLLCLLVRLYARWSIFKKFETDDYVMIVTMVRTESSMVCLRKQAWLTQYLVLLDRLYGIG